MGVADKLASRARSLKKELTALYYAYRHPRLGFWPKLLVIITLGYALSPIDLIPDFIPILGYLDDIIIIPLLISLSIKSIPPDIMRESREKAAREPVDPRKNWVAAVIFIAVWIAVLSAVMAALAKLFARRGLIA